MVADNTKNNTVSFIMHVEEAEALLEELDVLLGFNPDNLGLTEISTLRRCLNRCAEQRDQ